MLDLLIDEDLDILKHLIRNQEDFAKLIVKMLKSKNEEIFMKVIEITGNIFSYSNFQNHMALFFNGNQGLDILSTHYETQDNKIIDRILWFLSNFTETI